MPTTYTSLHYHIIFSTKYREPMIAEEWRLRLHEYLGGMIRGLDGVALAVGGVSDHVHILAGLKATHCLADFMRDLKKDATKWVTQISNAPHFAWQAGYAAITVSPSGLEAVRHYVLHQEEHHRSRDFRSELVTLLEKAAIPYDERYLD